MLSPEPVFPQGEGGQPDAWEQLDSSSINSVAFNRDQNVLKVHFRDGGTWSYKDVPMVKYIGLVYASSSGSYLRKQIIPYHTAEKLFEGAPEEPINAEA